MSILLRPMQAIVTPEYGESKVLQYQEVAAPS